MHDSRSVGSRRLSRAERLAGEGLLLAIVAVACQVPAGPERELSGQVLYERHCARCHGVDGNSPPEAPGAPSLADPMRMTALTDDRLDGIIREGRPPRMPGFGEQFLAPSRKLVIAYLRELAAAAPVAVSTDPPTAESPASSTSAAAAGSATPTEGSSSPPESARAGEGAGADRPAAEAEGAPPAAPSPATDPPGAGDDADAAGESSPADPEPPTK